MFGFAFSLFAHLSLVVASSVNNQLYRNLLSHVSNGYNIFKIGLNFIPRRSLRKCREKYHSQSAPHSTRPSTKRSTSWRNALYDWSSAVLHCFIINLRRSAKNCWLWDFSIPVEYEAFGGAVYCVYILHRRSHRLSWERHPPPHISTWLLTPLL